SPPGRRQTPTSPHRSSCPCGVRKDLEVASRDTNPFTSAAKGQGRRQKEKGKSKPAHLFPFPFFLFPWCSLPRFPRARLTGRTQPCGGDCYCKAPIFVNRFCSF